MGAPPRGATHISRPTGVHRGTPVQVNVRTEQTNMSGKVCLVTGANSGIGRSTAHALAKMNATIVMVCRDRRRAEPVRDQIKSATRNQNVELM
ncbi:MAG: SDR family NAD(P)-dependent oxidoreductase, partial [Blastocatellia bacterium]